MVHNHKTECRFIGNHEKVLRNGTREMQQIASLTTPVILVSRTIIAKQKPFKSAFDLISNTEITSFQNRKFCLQK